MSSIQKTKQDVFPHLRKGLAAGRPIRSYGAEMLGQVLLTNDRLTELDLGSIPPPFPTVLGKSV